jgi:two-component system sensor histidine kinase KdpD
VLRRTSCLAKSLNAPWIALHIETPRSSAAADSARIARDLALAGDLGAEVITTMGGDFVDLLLQIASQRNVTQIVIGDSPLSHRGIFQYDPAFDRLLSEAEDANMHLVRVRQGMTAKPLRLLEVFRESAWPQYLVAAGLVSVITLVAWWLGPRIGGPHAAALIFLLAVVVLGSFVGRGPTLVAATMSALLWDYFILSPVYAFRITHLEDALLLGMYFVVALLMGQLTTRIRSQEAAERLRKERASALYLLTRELTEAGNLDQIVQVAMRQMGQIFDAETTVLLSNLTEASLSPHPASAFKLSGDDERAAAWAIKQGRRAGKFSENLPLADAMYVPLAGSEGIVGVIGVRFSQKTPPTIHQLKLLEASSQQIAFALDRQRVREISEKARMLAESERLGKTLLNSMSHEIRTPIAVLKSAASNLAQIKHIDSPDNRLAISAAIQDATDRLDRLVGNVLDITRLESGHVKPRFNECDVSDLIYLAISETEQDLLQHKVKVEIAAGLPIVRMDFVLMQQALSNLLSNAAFHTPPGTEVLVTARVEKEFLLLEVADRGPGILPESLERIFEKFYRGQNAPTGGTGLGLSLVKGFVDAQGGRVQARNRVGGGALFTIFLPSVNNPTLIAQADL